MLRDGGLLAFITSQAVLNSARNEPIRKALMHDNNLISAIRLPNNLFTDHAGTQVGSDLIVLQKNSQKQGLSEIEQRFCQTYTTADDTTNNVLFENLDRIVHTSLYKDTDLYGRPAWIYEHGEGVEGIARDMKKMLLSDLTERLDIGLYRGLKKDEPVIKIFTGPKPELPRDEQITIKQQIGHAPAQNTSSRSTGHVQLSLFDLLASPQQTA